MNKLLISTLPLLAQAAGVANNGHALDAPGGNKRDVVCVSYTPSTVYVPTTIYVTVPYSDKNDPSTSLEAPETLAAVLPEEADSTYTVTVTPTTTAWRQPPRPGVTTRYWTAHHMGNNTMNGTQPAGTGTGTGKLPCHQTGTGSWSKPLSTGTPSTNSSSKSAAPATKNKSLSSRSVLYFTNWGIYGANYQPQDIPADKVTHLLYAFADISPDGTIISSDPYADLEKHYGDDDSGSDKRANNAYGVVKQLYALKKKHRQLKTLLSIGGWTYSQQGKFSKFAGTEDGRKRFASSAVKFVQDWGMDGIDIDWEYPENDTEANNFVLLLKEVRDALDRYAYMNSQNYHYLLTVASPAGPEHYKQMDLKSMDPYLDAWHLMAYDYAGSWDKTTGHQANVNPDAKGMAATKFNTEQAVADYMASGILPSKIILGMPLYGRSFADTDGLGKPFNGAGKGSTEKGVWLYRDLPRPGAKESVDDQVGAAWSYDPSTRELVSYDTPASAKVKAKYMQSKGLGGALFWEASGDKSGDDSIIGTMASSMGDLDNTQNMLDYKRSQYDNIKNNLE